MKKKITVAIITQKGGCTKSTTTMITANIFQNLFRKKVAVVDYDNQSSITELRLEDKAVASQNEDVMNAIQKQGIPEFEVVPDDPFGINRASIAEIVETFDDDTDFIFFDYPGIWTKPNATNSPEESHINGLVEKLVDDWRQMDVILVPITFSDMDNRSTNRFLFELSLEYNISSETIPLFYLFHTKVDRQISKYEDKVNFRKDYYRELGFESFETYIPLLKKLNSGLTVETTAKSKKISCLLNTVLLPDLKDLEQTNYLKFANELLSKCQNL